MIEHNDDDRRQILRITIGNEKLYLINLYCPNVSSARTDKEAYLKFWEETDCIGSRGTTYVNK